MLLGNGAYDENDAAFYIPPLGLSFVHHVNLNLADILDSIANTQLDLMMVCTYLCKREAQAHDIMALLLDCSYI